MKLAENRVRVLVAASVEIATRATSTAVHAT